MNRYKFVAPLIFALISLAFLVIGCRDLPDSSPSIPAPESTVTLDLTPRPTDIALVFPNEIAAGQRLFVEASNQGNLPYVFFRSEGENCLSVQKQDAKGQYFPTHHELACDVLVYIIVKPGERRVVGSWDLTTCADAACAQRTPALPGIYETSAVFYPFFGDITKIDASSQKNEGPPLELSVTFTLLD